MKRLLVAFPILMMAQISFSATIHVPADQPTIQAAINVSTHGDLVMVSPGLYQENLNYDGKRIRITGSGPEFTTLTPLIPSAPAVTFTSGEDGVTEFSHFTVAGGNGSHVILISNGADPLISRCVFRDFGGEGDVNVVIRVRSDAYIEYSLFYNNGGISCIGISDGGRADIINCTFDNNNRGFHTITGRGRAINNIVTNSVDYGIYGTYEEQDYNCSWNNGTNYAGGASPEAHDISSDPLYHDPSSDDYNLTINSPCIDAGHPDPAYDDPDGTRNDMGAFYFAQSYPNVIDISFGTEDRFHVTNHTPTVYWTFLDPENSQISYEIEIGIDDDWSVAEMWATGEVSSSDNSAVYSGAELEDGSFYYLRMRAFNGTDWSNWSLYSFRMNSIPSVPVLDSPVNQETVYTGFVQLTVQNSIDDDLDVLYYDFEVYGDPGLTELVHSQDGVTEQPNYTSSGQVTGLEDNTEYWWRARAGDGYESSLWTEATSFITMNSQVVHVPDDLPTIQAAINALSDLGTVIVSPGLYRENLNFNGKDIRVTGSGAEVTTLEPLDVYQPAVLMVSGEAGYAEFSDFTVAGGLGSNLILIQNGSDPTISRCIFRNFDGRNDDDVVIRVTSNALIKYNLFYNNGGISCIGISNNGRADIINNTFDNNRRGFHTVTGMGRAINNIVTNSVDYGIYGSFQEQEYNCVWNNGVDYAGGAVPGWGNISSDPLYLDAPSGDYNLTVNSPCIDAGNPSSLFNDPDGTRNDMGAFYYGQSYPFVTGINLGTEERFHVLNHTPTIYWTFVDPESDQISYEIEVGSDDEWSVPEMWATGEVSSSDNWAAYSGAELEDGNIYYLRIRVFNGTDWSNWSLYSFGLNSVPSVPVLHSPVNQVIIHVNLVNLTVLNSSDNESDNLAYDFEVYGDPGLTEMIYSEYDVAEQPYFTASDRVTGLDADVEYWWRARANDGYEISPWAEANSFITTPPMVIHVPADQPTIQAGIDAAMNGDSVVVSPGTYDERLNFNGKEITVCSEEGPATTIILGSAYKNPATPTVLFDNDEGPNSVLEGFTLAGGPIAIRVNSAPTIRRNILTDQTIQSWAALVIYGPCRIINNTICFAANGAIACYNSQADIRNNIIYRNDAYGIFEGTSQLEVDYNDVYGNSPDYENSVYPGPGSISLDPEFIDADTRDFHLMPNSPCVNTGDPAAEYDDPDGTRNDMGALPMDIEIPMVIRINLGDEEDQFHVVNHLPNIYWTFIDATGFQQAYEIEIGTDEDWAVAEMWATGEVSSSDTSAVYAGAQLEDGQTYYLRMRVSDGSDWGEWSNFMFKMNDQPTSPVSVIPPDQQQVPAYQVTLGVENSSDADGDILVYDFEVYSDPALTALHEIILGIPEQYPITYSSELADLDNEATFWWRARSFDGYEYSDWSEVWSFTAYWTELVKVPFDYETIQGAIDAVSEGGVVVVEAGTYVENVNFGGKDVKVIGVGRESAFLSPANINQPAVIISADEGRFAQLSGFTISGGTGNALVLVGGGAEPTISDNTFTEFALEKATDVVIRVTSAATIRDNLFCNNGGISCIGISDGGTASIINNTFDNNRRGIHTVTGRGVALNNIVTNCDDYGIFGEFEECDYNCVWSNHPNYEGGAQPGPHSISEDPLFVGYEFGYYLLSENSPCIDAGHPDPQYNDPDGTRNDMGAYMMSVYDLPLPIDIRMCCQDLMHIVNHMPDIYWKYIDISYPMTQAAFEIEVGSDHDWTEAEMWATGMVASIDTTALYMGAPLNDGEMYYLRMRVHNGDKWGAWRELQFRMNSNPAAPVSSWPPSNSEVNAYNVNLSVANSSDPENDNLTYSYVICTSRHAYTQISQVDGVEEEENYTSSGPMYGVDGGRRYWWRARAFDGYEYSYWTPFDSFTTSQNFVINVPQELGSIQAAINVANDGDVILVGPGQYSENIDFSGKQIKVTGSDGPGNTLLQPDDGTEPLITFTSGEGPYCEVSGFTITAAPGQTGENVQLILISGNSNPTITENVFCDFNLPASDNNVVIRSVNSAPNIMRNLFYGNICSGCIGAEGDGATRIVNNTFDDNNIGFSSVSGQAVAINNIVTRSADYGIGGQFAACDYNCFWINQSDYAGGAVPGPNSIEDDPQYIDNTARNYRLMAGSPCIDAGDPAIFPPYYGGELIDIGRYEAYQSGFGDANGDGRVDVGDVVFIVNFVFKNGAAPWEMVLADSNADCFVNIGDAVFLINYTFRNGPPPMMGCAYEVPFNGGDIPGVLK